MKDWYIRDMGKNWWVILFCVGCLVASWPFLQGKRSELNQLCRRLEMMQADERQALQDRVDLQERLASQSDPAWIEMVLMRDLGVVPEGFVKVHFGGT